MLPIFTSLCAVTARNKRLTANVIVTTQSSRASSTQIYILELYYIDKFSVLSVLNSFIKLCNNRQGTDKIKGRCIS